MSRVRVVVLLLGALTMGLPSAGAAAQDALEFQVKAAFLFNFMKFVTWPPGRVPTASQPAAVCVVGDTDFATVVAETVRDKSIEGATVRVLNIVPGESITSCHIAYFPPSPTAKGEAQLRQPPPVGVLTVHEADQALASGVVRFFLGAGRVRLEINTAAADRAQLQLSSRLLSVAKRVQVAEGS